MPLPWLIGIGVAALVTAVAAINSDDEPSNSNNSDEEERRHIQEAAKKRAENERQKKRKNSLALFKEKGHSIGKDISFSLNEWVDVNFISDAEIKIDLKEICTSGLIVSQIIDKQDGDNEGLNELTSILEGVMGKKNEKLSEVIDNLVFFKSSFDVHLRGSSQLHGISVQIKNKETEVDEIRKVRLKLMALKTRLINYSALSI